MLTIACEKVPLLAPTGSTITLTASTNALPADGSTNIVAQVIEAPGTPPHSGTHVIFTTTLGRVEPSEAETDTSGRVVVRFVAGGQNGTATISASSGAATTGNDGSIRIMVGTAAVGRISLSANPNPISSNGGVSQIVANVVDVNGNALTNAPVNFSTSAGQLANSFVNTDQNGVALTTLTTSAQATVTATVGVQGTGTGGGGTGGGGTGNGGGGTGSTGGQATATVQVNVNPLPTVSITGPTGTIVANSPVTFTISASVASTSTAQIRDVTVNFGDGSRPQSLGAANGSNLQVQHIFEDDGTFTVSVTVTDTLGGVTSASTIVVVQPEPPLRVSLSVSSQPASSNTTIYTFTATVIPSTETVISYEWFDGAVLREVTTNNQFVFTALTGEVHTIRVLITTSTGRQTSTTRVIP
jgi:adhesin/invasin